MFTETFVKQYPIVMLAISRHMQEHDLPVPLTIEADAATDGRESIELHFSWDTGAAAAWVETCVLDEENNAYVDPSTVSGVSRLEPYFRTSWAVRLPNSGIRLRIRVCRDLPLRLVSGEAVAQ